MKVSVIIPYLNAAGTVGCTFDALVAQSWPSEWEVIIADNGSTDALGSIVAPYKTQIPLLKIIDASAKRGAAYARNVAARASTGDRMLFCDADDVPGCGWATAMALALNNHHFVAARAILLNKGEVVHEGSANEVVHQYLHAGHVKPCVEWPVPADAPGNEVVRMRAMRVQTESGVIMDRFDIRRPIEIEVEFGVLKSGHVFVPGVAFYNEEVTVIFIVHDRDPEWQRKPRPVGVYCSTVRIPANLLSEGFITLSVSIVTESPFRAHMYAHRVIGFGVDDSGMGDTARGDFHGRWPGAVRPLLEWRTRYRLH